MAAPRREILGRPQALETAAEIQGLYFGSQNRETYVKIQSKTIFKTSTPKHEYLCRNDAKRETESMPKHIQNQC